MSDSIPAWLPRAAALHPRRPAVIAEDGSCTYAELLVGARGAAGALRASGVEPGARVALVLEPGVAFAEALHGCLLLGAVATPVGLRLGPAERAVQTDECAAIVSSRLKAGDSGPLGDCAAHPLDAPAAVIHTSGTTGNPKPVELTYGNFGWSALGSALALGLDPAERWLGAMPLHHVGGLSILVRSAIYATTAILHPHFETSRVLKALHDGQATVVSMVPTMLGRLLDAGLERPPGLRCALIGGGPLPATVVERAREAGIPVRQTYGLTEACSQVTTALAGDTQSAGPPLVPTRVEIASDGEILVTSPTVAPRMRTPGGVLHTGDLGVLDEQGRLMVTGRKADTIVTGGENVAPAEVEDVLRGHLAVADAAVHPVADSDWGEMVAATVVLRDGALANPEDLRAWCAERLASYKVPKVIRFAPGLPRTPSGKLLRRQLR